MSVFLVVSGLFGCESSKKHTVDDIISLHTSYYGMESNPVYSFALRKQDENWLFSASCNLKSRENYYTSFSCFPIPTEEAEEILDIIREEGEIERLRKYRNPIHIFHAADAPARSSGMVFADGSRVEKETSFSDRLQKYLYTLADMHYEAAESVEFESVCIYRHCMDYSSSYSYTLEKNENDWYFSFDAVIDSSGVHTEVEKQRIDEHNAEEILKIIKEQQLVAKVRQYEPPPDDGISVLDETTYGISFDFPDGSSVHAPINAGSELSDAFYSLAGRINKK